MRSISLWLLAAAASFSGTIAQTLQSELLEVLSSFLANPTVIGDIAPIETSPALVSTLEAYINFIQDNSLGAVPTAPPAFITAFPTAAQNDFTRIFAEENSIISAAGGLTANGYVPLPDSSFPSVNASLATSNASVHSSTRGTSQPRTSSMSFSPSMVVTARTTSGTTTPASSTVSTTAATGSASNAAAASAVHGGLGVLAGIAAIFFWL